VELSTSSTHLKASYKMQLKSWFKFATLLSFLRSVPTSPMLYESPWSPLAKFPVLRTVRRGQGGQKTRSRCLKDYLIVISPVFHRHTNRNRSRASCGRLHGVYSRPIINRLRLCHHSWCSIDICSERFGEFGKSVLGLHRCCNWLASKKYAPKKPTKYKHSKCPSISRERCS